MSINEQLAEFEEKLKTQDSKITDLKQNVKWLYKYGGSGTGTGGGSGSTSTKTPALVYSSSTGNISVELGSTNSNAYITTAGIQNLNFFLRYLNTEHTYKVTYSGNGGLSWTTIIVSDTNDFVIPLTIEGNINIRIRLQDVTDNSNGPATLVLSFITNPITITTYLIGENANGSSTVKGEIFMQNYTKIWAVMDVTPHLSGSFKAVSDSLPEAFTLSEMEVDKTYTNKQLLYDSEFLADASNVGAYSIKYNTEFNNTLSGIQTNEFEESYTLIPNSTYAIIKAEEGSVYTTKKDSNYYEFQAGSISFIGFIYKGSNDGETFQNVTTEIYDDQNTLLHTFPVETPVSERANFLSGTIGTFYFNNNYITNSSGNWFEIRVTIAQESGDTPQIQSYYLFVKKNENVLNWYPDTIAGEWYFNKENKSNIGIDNSVSEISCHLSVDPQTYTWTNNLNVNTPESHFAIAIKAEEGNDEVLFATLQTTSTNVVEIYQNKIKLAQYGDIEIYIPMDGSYHILQLYGRIVAMQDANTPQYEWVAYIDGVIDGALASYTSANISFTGLTLNPNSAGIFTVNHFNYTIFDCGTYKRWDDKYIGMTDSNVTEYNYKYFCTTNTSYKESDYAEAIRAFNTVKYTYDTDNKQEYLTKMSASSVSTLQSMGGLPVLIFQVKQQGLTDILKQMQTTYGEEDEPGAIQLENIKYFKTGNTEEETCDSSLSTTDYYYTIEIQGSSTKGFKFKNWELGINSNQNEIIPIFSLDYNEEGGFFPEQSFTLKGDIVDSSHCVNTSIGDFVNDNCTPFNTGYRNCLSGKPLLVLIENVPDSSDAVASEYYLLGIYNYNLGRKSKYNLNYAERPTLNTGAEGFIVQTTPTTSTKSTYASAEIANNSCFWDFSQYDDSILFENQYKMEDNSTPSSDFLATHNDTYYMWGDLVYSQGFDINKKLKACVKGISRAGGFLFDTFLKKKFDSSAYFTELNESSSSKAYKVINAVPDSKHKYIRKVKYNSTSNTYSYIFEPSTTAESTYTQQDLTDCIYGRADAEGNITQQPYINYDSVMEYYVIMQAFGLVDSPMKNLNMKTWNGDTFYSAFYDMDTGLGENNAGQITITPFAFSDYWETNDQGIVTRHLDYWPENTTEIGFDVPSSFLFAIGKYAAYYQQTNPSIGDKLLSPVEFWAKLRQANGNLRDSKYFVNTYFNKKFTKTHPMIWNMNYRSKYLVQASGGFDNIQFSKFHGRRINRTIAWLNNRLHMLDAYFNVNNLAYSAENNANASLKLSNPDSTLSNLSQNSDVILLQNIFSDSGTEGIKTDSNIVCTVEALNYSPFIAQSTNTTADVRLFNDNKQYNVAIAVQGNQSIYPYGSSRWTYMDTADSFLQNGVKFYMKNDYMTNLVCSKNHTSEFSPAAWELHTPKMQNISITGSTFKGALQVYPGTALTDLNLSNSAITFETFNTGAQSYNVCPNLKNLTLNNFKGSVTLRNCNMLSNIVMTGAEMQSLEINPYKGNCDFSNTSISKLKIYSETEGSTFSLTNDSTITEIELSGFKSVTIEKCNKLKNIKFITMPEEILISNCTGGINFTNLNSNGTINFKDVKKLKLKQCTFDSSVSTIVGDTTLTYIVADGYMTNPSNVTFNLTKCNNLTTADFNWTYASSIIFNSINVDDVNVRFKCGQMQSIQGTLTITHNNGYTFQDTKLKSLGAIIFDSNVTNATGTFSGSSSLSSIKSLTVKGKLQSIASMCRGIAFTSSELFAKALTNSASTITNMSGCFEDSKVTNYTYFLDSISWTGITTKAGMLGACNSNVETLSTTVNKSCLTFPNASSVDPLCLFQSTGTNNSNTITTTITFTEDALSATTSTTLNFSQIVVKGITSTTFLTNAANCTSVSNLEFIKNTTLIFSANTHITTIFNCIQNNTVNSDDVSNFFKVCVQINSSLNALNLTNPLQIATFVDYSKLKQSTTLFSEDYNIEKVATEEEFVNLVNTIFDPTNNNLTSVYGVFKNCTIICNEDCFATKTLDVPIPINSKITNISNMFNGCHAFFTDDEGNKIKIYLNFTSNGEIGFSNLTGLRQCISTWEDCYLNKLSEHWFVNTNNLLTNCTAAFRYAQFRQRYSDDLSDKVAYVVNADIAIGNQLDKAESERKYKTLNSTISDDFYVNSKGHYIIPEKFFYYDNNGSLVNKTSSLFYGNEIFEASNLYGLLPDKLFATNSRPTNNCTNMFKYCTIIPYYVTSKYQTLIPNTWNNSLSEEESRKMLQYTTYKIDIYCITPNGTEDTPYLTGALGNSINGAIIVPTIHQNQDVSVKWSSIKEQLGDSPENYVNLTLTPTADEDVNSDDITIGVIDFIYQYNQYSLDSSVSDMKNLLPESLGMPDSWINESDTVSWYARDKNNNAIFFNWDWLTGISLFNTNSINYLLSWAYNYQPSPITVGSSSISKSDELFKIHYGIQYNGGDNVLYVDGTNTDGLYSKSTSKINAIGLINDKAALLLYGPIFHKDLKVITNISDESICSNLATFFGSSYAGLGGTVTTDISASGYRYYRPSNTSNKYYAYDVSRNLVFPVSANNTTSIKYIIFGKNWKSSEVNAINYTVYRYYNKRGIGNYSNYVELYV